VSINHDFQDYSVTLGISEEEC